MTKVQRSLSPVSSWTTRSRADKLLAAQHHNRVVKRKRGKRKWKEVFFSSYSGDPLGLL
jgi:hypothetical protein